MIKVGICGFFGEGPEFSGGQPVRTKMIIQMLTREFGDSEVVTVNTYKWKNNPLRLLFRCYHLNNKCKNILLITTYNGIEHFSKVFLVMNKFFKRKLHFVVIGSYLVEKLKEDNKLKNRLKKFDYIYVQSKIMVNRLNDLGLMNVKLLHNFRQNEIVDEKDFVFFQEKPFKLATFSRISKEKGIEEAIEAVSQVNKYFNKEICVLDIYGIPDSNYLETFNEIKERFSSYIRYKGIVDSQKSVNVLKDYFLVLFPTYYQGEGFAGTILDSLCAGVPILATDWNYNSEFVDDYKTGILFRTRDTDDLIAKLKWCIENPDNINEMKQNCISKAKKYKPEIVIKKLTENLS